MPKYKHYINLQNFQAQDKNTIKPKISRDLSWQWPRSCKDEKQYKDYNNKDIHFWPTAFKDLQIANISVAYKLGIEIQLQKID